MLTPASLRRSALLTRALSAASLAVAWLPMILPRRAGARPAVPVSPAPAEQPAATRKTADLRYAYTVNLATNPFGGIRPGRSAYADNHQLTLTIPLASSSAALADPVLILEAYDRNGSDLSATAIGNQFTVQQLYGGETLGLYGVRLEGELPAIGGRFKLGRLTSGDDFATWPIYGLAMSNAINGNPQSLPVNSGFSSFPDAVWGGMVDHSLGEHISLRSGAYQITDPEVLRYRGFNWAIRPGDGLLLISQLESCDGCLGVGWTGQRLADEPQVLPAAWQLEPSYPLHRQRLALGGYWSLHSQPFFEADATAASSYGAWLHVDRTLARRSPGGPALSLWGSLTSSPQPSVARLPLFWALGLVRYGVTPSRPQDSAMLAVYQGRFSPSFLASISPEASPPGQETVVELGYRYRTSRHAFLQPNLQLVLHPSGLSIPAALVLGLQAGVSF